MELPVSSPRIQQMKWKGQAEAETPWVSIGNVQFDSNGKFEKKTQLYLTAYEQLYDYYKVIHYSATCLNTSLTGL